MAIVRRIKSISHAYWHKERCILLLLALFTLLLHLSIIAHDSGFIFDEIHYVPEANSIIDNGELVNPEHPSLAKLFIASGTYILGDNPWGWRIFPVLFSVVSVVLFYLVSRRLTDSRVAFVATFLFILENLVFIHSGIAVLEVFWFTFMLLAFLLYLNGRYALSGISFALCALSKMTGVLGIVVVVVHWFAVRNRGRRYAFRSVGLLILSSLVGFLVLLPFLEYAATREWLNPIDRIYDIALSISVTRGIQPPEQLIMASFPWEWVLLPMTWKDASLGHHLLMISPSVWFLIIPSMAYVLYRYLKTHSTSMLFLLLWFTGMYILWIPIAIITDRVMYLYYFYPAIGPVCIGIALILIRLWQLRLKSRFGPLELLPRLLVILYIALHIYAFYDLTPLRWAI